MKTLLLIGNITFHHFTEEEKTLFKTDKEQKALIHEIQSIQLYDDKDKAYEAGDDAESYLIFPDFKGEVAFESEEAKQKIRSDIKLLISMETIKKNSHSLYDGLLPNILKTINQIK